MLVAVGVALCSPVLSLDRREIRDDAVAVLGVNKVLGPVEVLGATVGIVQLSEAQVLERVDGAEFVGVALPSEVVLLNEVAVSDEEILTVEAAVRIDVALMVVAVVVVVVSSSDFPSSILHPNQKN